MARVITFSRTFPAYHPKAGQPTYFVEKFWKSVFRNDQPSIEVCPHMEAYLEKATKQELSSIMADNVLPKHHTIREGSRWKVGDKFSPRVWSGKPYRSKQIIIAPDIEVKQIWDIEVDEDGAIWIYSENEGKEDGFDVLNRLAMNDGLSLQDLKDWFQYSFTGQIICWNESVNY